jgi:hypothetical protein
VNQLLYGLAGWWHAIRGWMADDTFDHGGDLTDTDTPFAARDKVAHLVLGGVIWFALWGLRIPIGPRAMIMFALTIAWELLELARFIRWQNAGAPAPWPLACDRFSWRDVVAGLAGALLCQLPLWLRGAP